MKNAATGRAKADLPLLYDELESKLRSLESLGKTQDKYGDFLTPLVESCLPEEVLVAWERSRNHQTESEGSRSLEQLMNFLRQEVKGEEMVLLARTGLTPHQNPRKRIIMQHSEGRIVYRHCRVVFGVSSSPFLLNASIMHLLENCQPQHEEVAQKLKSSFYVDNCVSGVFNTDEQGRFIEHAKLIMLNGCFNLRGFESNVAGKNVDRSSGDTSVLGVIWNLETDTLKCCTDMDTLTCETKITKRIKYRSKLLKDLRQRFRNEYLSQLIQKHNEKESRDPQIGEVVLVGDDNKKRLFWALAKIIELIPGRDGKIRTVRLKTQHGKMLRPIQRIYPLEIRSNENLQRGMEESIPTVSETLSPDEVIFKKYTSSGRCVKKPKRLDLFNRICYVLETL
ncbi:DUF5641 domain-containing protein [Trichonephila clavipes]|nr:DUF5641 domain-containing protein [Trichonephila clavipes]